VTAGPVGFFGGTFNPVHYGHLRSALELRETLGLAEVRMVPAAQPPHREAPVLSAAQRAELVSLAVRDEPGLRCDMRELEREGPSYTIDSLRELREELGAPTPICLIVGADAVAGLDSWHRWRELLHFAHLVVIARPGWELPEEGLVAELLQQHLTEQPETLQHNPAGSVILQELRPLAISSTEIRALVGAGRSPRYLLPDVVWERIRELGLYRDDQ
jgi:nicotinate-nucleotide adenylyltransferase